MNNFGGDWTTIKIEILVDYAKAYLSIMKDRKFFNLLYFDGFAGSGFIINKKKVDVKATIGAAVRIIQISEPRGFDTYYFVEKGRKNFKLLKESTKEAFPDKKIHTFYGDCNKKMLDMATFLSESENSKFRVLAYIDPCGMQVKWDSIKALKGLWVDMWILVPTGLGVNRLLTKDGKISDQWMNRLEVFLGLTRKQIETEFYKKTPTLFEDIEFVEKRKNAINISANIYWKRLKEVFDYVSKPYELKNSSNSIMYHLFLGSNNKTAEKIANSIVKKYSN